MRKGERRATLEYVIGFVNVDKVGISEMYLANITTQDRDGRVSYCYGLSECDTKPRVDG